MIEPIRELYAREEAPHKITVRRPSATSEDAVLSDVIDNAKEVQIRDGYLWIFFVGGHKVYAVGKWIDFTSIRVRE